MLIEPPSGERPADIPLPVYWLASFFVWLFGWKYVGGLPNYPKMVVIAGPHTSNWDGFWYMVMTAKMRARTHVVMKAEIARTPLLGWLFKQFGGIPVERKTSQNTVEQIVEQFQKRDKLMLVIAPEGTRHYTDYWRAGFYWMAYKADVPIAMAYLNYQKKTMGFCGVMKPSGDIHADMEIFAKQYAEYGGPRYPELFGPVRVRSSERKAE